MWGKRDVPPLHPNVHNILHLVNETEYRKLQSSTMARRKHAHLGGCQGCYMYVAREDTTSIRQYHCSNPVKCPLLGDYEAGGKTGAHIMGMSYNEAVVMTRAQVSRRSGPHGRDGEVE